MKVRDTAILMLSLLFFAALMPTFASPTKMYLDPPTDEVVHGEIFDVILRVDEVKGLFLWVATIEWNATELELQPGSPVEGGCLKSGGPTVFTWEGVAPGIIDNMTCGLQGPIPGVDVPPAPSDLAKMTFKVLCDKVCTYMAVNITYSDMLNNVPIPHTVQGGLYHVIPELAFTLLGLVAMFSAFGVYRYKRKNR